MSQSVVTLDETTYQQALANDGLVAVRLWANWCMPCRMMAPIYQEVAEKMAHDTVVFGEVDIDQYPSIAAQLGVRSIPTVVLFKNGQEVTRSAGLMPAPQLTDMVATYR